VMKLSIQRTYCEDVGQVGAAEALPLVKFLQGCTGRLLRIPPPARRVDMQKSRHNILRNIPEDTRHTHCCTTTSSSNNTTLHSGHV
jgi:hypothetical protein